MIMIINVKHIRVPQEIHAWNRYYELTSEQAVESRRFNMITCNLIDRNPILMAIYNDVYLFFTPVVYKL